jgi:MFS family permease
MTAAIRRRAERASSRNLALALLATTQFVLILDIAIVTVALPSIGTDLGFAPADLSWVINAYALLFGGFLLLGGRMADLIGRRRMFMAGLVLFTTASLAGALAQSALWLVIARGTQGLGAALVSPAALALVMTLFREGAERNKALGIWGAVAGSGGAAGATSRASGRSTWPAPSRSPPAWPCLSTPWSTPTMPAGPPRRRSAWVRCRSP